MVGCGWNGQGTTHILRKQNDRVSGVGGSTKWPFLLMFSTVAYADMMFQSEKIQNYGDLRYG